MIVRYIAKPIHNGWGIFPIDIDPATGKETCMPHTNEAASRKEAWGFKESLNRKLRRSKAFKYIAELVDNPDAMRK